MYYGIPRTVVEKYVSLCAGCQLKKPQVTSAPLKPIIAKGFFSRLQVSASVGGALEAYGSRHVCVCMCVCVSLLFLAMAEK